MNFNVARVRVLVTDNVPRCRECTGWFSFLFDTYNKVRLCCWWLGHSVELERSFNTEFIPSNHGRFSKFN